MSRPRLMVTAVVLAFFLITAAALATSVSIRVTSGYVDGTLTTMPRPCLNGRIVDVYHKYTSGIFATAKTDSEGRWTVSILDAPGKMIPSGYYHAVVRPKRLKTGVRCGGATSPTVTFT